MDFLWCALPFKCQSLSARPSTSCEIQSGWGTFILSQLILAQVELRHCSNHVEPFKSFYSCLICFHCFWAPSSQHFCLCGRVRFWRPCQNASDLSRSEVALSVFDPLLSPLALFRLSTRTHTGRYVSLPGPSLFHNFPNSPHAHILGLPKSFGTKQ